METLGKHLCGSLEGMPCRGSTVAQTAASCCWRCAADASRSTSARRTAAAFAASGECVHWLGLQSPGRTAKVDERGTLDNSLSAIARGDGTGGCSAQGMGEEAPETNRENAVLIGCRGVSCSMPTRGLGCAGTVTSARGKARSVVPPRGVAESASDDGGGDKSENVAEWISRRVAGDHWMSPTGGDNSSS